MDEVREKNWRKIKQRGAAYFILLTRYYQSDIMANDEMSMQHVWMEEQGNQYLDLFTREGYYSADIRELPP